jgi:hypothetical protein
LASHRWHRCDFATAAQQPALTGNHPNQHAACPTENRSFDVGRANEVTSTPAPRGAPPGHEREAFGLSPTTWLRRRSHGTSTCFRKHPSNRIAIDTSCPNPETTTPSAGLVFPPLQHALARIAWWPPPSVPYLAARAHRTWAFALGTMNGRQDGDDRERPSPHPRCVRT